MCIRRYHNLRIFLVVAVIICIVWLLQELNLYKCPKPSGFHNARVLGSYFKEIFNEKVGFNICRKAMRNRENDSVEGHYLDEECLTWISELGRAYDKLQKIESQQRKLIRELNKKIKLLHVTVQRLQIHLLRAESSCDCILHGTNPTNYSHVEARKITDFHFTPKHIKKFENYVFFCIDKKYYHETSYCAL